jgi:hypothetical protein
LVALFGNTRVLGVEFCGAWKEAEVRFAPARGDGGGGVLGLGKAASLISPLNIMMRSSLFLARIL